MLRPFVPISLAHRDAHTPLLEGLVDTGVDATLASALLADELGIDLDVYDGETSHALGDRIVTARYRTVELRLHPDEASPEQFHAWTAHVGFIADWHSYGFVLLGSVGFLDHWTVTASRFAQAVAVERRDALAQRFGTTPI